MSNLATYRLGDIATFVNGRAYSMPEMLLDGKYRIVRVGNFTGKDEWYYSNMELDADKYCENGDLLYKWACTFGPEIWTEEKAIYHYHIWKVIPNEKYISKDYLYYLLSFMTSKWMKAAHGSTMVHITKEIMESNTVTIPVDINEQRLVAAQLNAIDAKIDNNNAIAAELEGMAKDLYDYWFVQFDFPDENGKPYKSSGGKMVWNDELKREIPEGWEVDRLGKVCDTLLGGTPDTENALYWNGDIPWLNSGEVATSPVLNAEKTITKEGLKNSATSFASAGAVVMSITRYIRPSILGIDACFNQSVIAVIPNEQIHSTYLYLFMLSQVERYMRLRTGAQQPHINKETVDSTLITLPVDSVLNQFYDRVEPLFERQMIAMKEAKELESLRDFLLPMLMNGQVKVKGA